MKAKEEPRPDPLTQGKGRSDEVDQSKGMFPFGAPHPKGAELRAPGTVGGPYEESGRGGISYGHETPESPPEGEEPTAEAETDEDERDEPREEAEEKEPKGTLPRHEP